MPLAVGTRVGPYEVTALIGQGGMGEVYRATDAKLKRQVAIKVLPASFAADPDRLARFQREAEVLASLNHPNIAGVYGLETQEGQDAPCLVMELVEGPTLAELIEHGHGASEAESLRSRPRHSEGGVGASGGGAPRAGKQDGGFAMSETLAIARQITDALSAAHAQGVVHRDLKPANIKVRPDGTVKVLDFGLAKAFDSDASSATSTHSPTLTSPAMTRVGVIIGTAAYMSPEQARGKSADKRADVWAFGVVLFEMLTGVRLFVSNEVSDTLALVLTKEPDWSLLPSSTPVPVRRLLRRCLEKDRTRRLADIADARLEIEDVLAGSPAETQPTIVSVDPRPRAMRVLPWLLAGAAVTAALVMLALWKPWQSAPAEGPVRLNAKLGAPVVIAPNPGGAVALSPDGSTLAFVARRVSESALNPQLYVRRFDELEARALSGTERAAMPFFSPDGRWIAFFADEMLKKVAPTGGAVVTLCEAPTPRGGWWGDDDTIVFSSLGPLGLTGGPVQRVPAAGGEPEEITSAGQDYGHTWPQLLPGGRGLLYTVPRTYAQYNDATIMVQPLPTGGPRIVHQGGTFGRYVASGHLTFLRDSTVFAAPFDLDTMVVTGPPAPVLEGVAVAIGGGALLSMSQGGSVAYIPTNGVDTGRAPILWLERSGAPRVLRADPTAWATPRLSPDGRRLALAISDGRQLDIWVYDLEREALSRLTTDPADDIAPVWSPDGTRIAFGSSRSGVTNIYWQRADGTGAAERLIDTPTPQLPDAWHPNGRALVFHEGNPLAGRQSITILPLETDAKGVLVPGKPTEFVGGASIKAFATFSPDGQWIAYVSLESGRAEVYVQPYPGPGGRWQVSSGGGSAPSWSHTRPELYYASTGGLNQRMMVVPYTTDGLVFNARRPEVWSEVEFSYTPPIATWGPAAELHPDGERFVVAPARTVGTTEESQLFLVFNYFSELTRALSPARP